jgi:DNA-directed RNA polymerase sigma subunit (sigma70/sigma32)
MSVHEYAAEDFGDADALTPEQAGAYESPVMARMRGEGKLTLELLRTHVPVFHDGEEAARRIAEGEYATEVELDDLHSAVRAGERAKEILILAGIPLIKHLAKREHQRRQNWQSQVTFEDLVQEGSGGLLRGLRAYKVNGGQTSPTNYLGQWILTDMRRNVEAIDNDFGVAYDAAEQFRKIRAIRSRLSASLGREPTDEEVLEAASDPMFRGGAKIGRVKKVSATPKRQLTQRQLDQEREFRSRVGHAVRFADSSDEESYGPTPEQGRPIHDDTPDFSGDPNRVVEDAAREGLTRLMLEAFNLMGLPLAQREVISRRYGLPPHDKEQSVRDISRDMNLYRDKVSKVIDAFTAEMARPGGAFHRACGHWSEEDLADLGLGWTVSVLGRLSDVPADQRATALPAVLTGTLGQRSNTPAPPEVSPTSMAAGQVCAQFMCDYHGWGFVAVYQKRSEVPQDRACPQCGRASALVRVSTQ